MDHVILDREVECERPKGRKVLFFETGSKIVTTKDSLRRSYWDDQKPSAVITFAFSWHFAEHPGLLDPCFTV